MIDSELFVLYLSIALLCSVSRFLLGVKGVVCLDYALHEVVSYNIFLAELNLAYSLDIT